MHTTTLETLWKTPWRQSRRLQAYGTKFTPAQLILGIGERAGNAETEKVLLNLYLHYGVKKYEGKTQKLKQTADYIGKATGYIVPPNKAIVGDYGFAHESGIHTHGVLNDPGLMSLIRLNWLATSGA